MELNIATFVDVDGARKHIGNVIVDTDEIQITDVLFDELWKEWQGSADSTINYSEFIEWLVLTKNGFDWPQIETIYKVIKA